MPDLPGPTSDQSVKDKKKDKIRSVWISFVGRIVAQVIGALASVVLGILILQRYQSSGAPPGGDPPAAETSTAVRTHGQSAIAVLPFDNFSRLPEDAYVAHGMTEVLISDLAQVKGWRVISRTSSATYRDTSKSIPQIGQELNVDWIVEGSVTKAGDAVRVVVQLIDARSDEHVWSRSYDRTTRDLLGLQGDLAREIAKAVKVAIVPAHEVRLARRSAFDPQVYDLYLRGRYQWNQRTPDGISAAVRLFSEAIGLEPQFALAHVGLADAYSLGGAPSSGPADVRGRLALARRSAERALELAGHLAEAHAALAAVQFFGERDLTAAEQSFRRAIDLNPTYAIAHEWYAVMLAEQGRAVEALTHIETAVALDPDEATMHQARGLVHYYARRYGESVAALDRSLQLRPQLPLARVLLVKAHTLAGDRGGALDACDAARGPVPMPLDLMVACGIAWYRFGDARAGDVERQIGATIAGRDGALAQWYGATGDLTQAFALLNRLHAAGNRPPLFAFDPLFEPLRADPRYAAIAANSSR